MFFRLKLSILAQAALSVFAIGTLSLLAEAPAFAGSAQSHGEAQQVATKSANSIAEIAASNPAFSTLVAALKKADLVDVLNGSTNFTVFAPTNEAFAALPEGTVEALLKPENKDQLVQILTYHVVPGQVLSTSLQSGQVPTVAGPSVDVSVGNSVAVNNAQVIQADIKASNGVIHVIDQVLLPAQ